MNKTIKFFVLLLLTALLFSAPIKPLPQTSDYDPKKALLGKKLFFDPILSKDGTIACATCHDLQRGGDDGFRVSTGKSGRKGTLNAPQYTMPSLTSDSFGMDVPKT